MSFFYRLVMVLILSPNCLSPVMGQSVDKKPSEKFPSGSILEQPFKINDELERFILKNAYKGLEKQTEQAKQLETQGLKKEDNAVLLASYILLAKTYEYYDRYAYALEYLEKALTIAKQNHSKRVNYLILSKKGDLFLQIGKVEKGITYLSEAYKVIKDDSYQKGGALQYLIANAHYHEKNFNDAITHGTLAVKDFSELPFDSIVYRLEYVSAWNTIGLAHEKMGHYDEALLSFQQSYQLATQWDNQFWKSLIIGNMGAVYALQGKSEKALPLLLKDLENSLATNEWRSAISSALSLADTYSQLDNFEKATMYHDSAANMIMGKDEYYQDQYYRVGAILHFREKKYQQAYQYQSKLMAIKDSIANSSFRTRLEKAKTLYDFDKQQSEITLLTKNQELQKNIIEKRNIVIIAAILGFLALFFLSIRLFRNLEEKKKDNMRLSEQQEEIRVQNESLKYQQQLLEEKNNMIEGINENLEEIIMQRSTELDEINKELDNFIYRASHDIRAPLRTILGLEGVAQTKAPSIEMKEVLAKIKETAFNMDHMLLKLQKAHSLNLQKNKIKTELVDISQLVEQILSNFSKSIAESDIEVVSNTKQMPLMSSRELLHLIISNLVENSVKFKSEHNPKLEINGEDHHGIYKIQVIDNGCGIASKFHEKVFEAFFKASDRSDGAGLGLYLVKKAVDILGGGITFESDDKTGSKFTLYIPMN